jgi:hypothetical protein
MRLRRNDIVVPIKNDGYVFFGRVNRVIGNRIEVIDCGKCIINAPMSDYKKENYKGYWENDMDGNPKRYQKMPTLRKLKQITSRYNPGILKGRVNLNIIVR